MATKWNMTRDINGYNGFGMQFSDLKYSCSLTTSSDTTLTVPSSMGMGGNGFSSSSNWLAVFEYTQGADVFVALNAVAQVPAGDTFALTTSDQNPVARQVKGGDVLHFFTAGTGVNVTVLFYALS
jgi:hypothetical protein